VLEGVSDSLDDASASNLAALGRLAEASIASNAVRLTEVAARLTAPRQA
jgi:hypothetical protein